jgi:hypothetical protein
MMKRIVAKKRQLLAVIALAAVALGLSCSKQPAAQSTAQSGSCPSFGWEEGLNQFLKPDAPFPIQDTAGSNPPDCNFHQWSEEAFVWATALDDQGTPRFMTLPTNHDLLSKSADSGTLHARKLKLAARPHGFSKAPGPGEGAGAFVEADGNILVSPNGYPVYGSIHMNPLYFDTARKNLIATGGYQSQDPNSTFPEGAAVFKATWLRLDDGQQAPAGAFTTTAQVPDLTTQDGAIVPSGASRTVTVALVGLHVVGHTVNHPEFLWGTFEHKLNVPEVPDGTFSTKNSNPNTFTFYQANTSFAQVNLAVLPPTLKLTGQKVSPINNAVLENQTGGENQTNGPANVANVNTQGQSFFASLKGGETVFANYNLIGTVWMAPNTYSIKSGGTDAVGSRLLANSTAETYLQQSTQAKPTNCFSCHNATSYSFNRYSSSNPTGVCPPALADRMIALSHVLGEGTGYEVPNQIPPPAAQQGPCSSGTGQSGK